MTDREPKDQNARDDVVNKSGHDEILRLLQDYFAVQLSADAEQKMRKHLRDCATCRAVYDAHVEAEQQVMGAQAARILSEQRILASVLKNPVVAADRSKQPLTAEDNGPVEGHIKGLWLRFLTLGMGGLVAAALLFVFVINPQFLTSEQNGAMRARGSKITGDELGLGLSGVRADGSLYDARRPEGLSLDDNLRFSFSNAASDPDKAARYLFVLGLDQKLKPYWYYPLPDEGPHEAPDPDDRVQAHAAQSIAIASGAQVLQQDLPYETELKRRHHAGPFWVLALFSRDALLLEDVQQIIKNAQQQNLSPQDIPWPQGVQTQIIQVRIVAGTK